MHQETFELNCSRTSLAMDGTLVVVVEMSLSTWLVCAEVPGLERRAMMKMSVDETELLSQLHRWRDEAEKRLDCRVSRICVAYEAGRDGFWLARCLRGSGIEAHVMHSTSIPVKRDHRRAKTDRFDCQLMMRAFLVLYPRRGSNRQDLHESVIGYGKACNGVPKRAEIGDQVDPPSFVVETPFHRATPFHQATTERPAGLICGEKIGLARRRPPPTAVPSGSGSEMSAEYGTPLYAD